MVDYSPPETSLQSQSDYDISEEATDDIKTELKNAYIRRQQAGEIRVVAINVWKKKVLWAAFLLIITSGFLVGSDIWYANVIGIAAAVLGFYGAIKKNTEFIFVYMVLLVLEFIKNVGIFIYYINEIELDMHIILLLIDCILEELFIVPLSLYYAFKLYRSLNVENKDANPY